MDTTLETVVEFALATTASEHLSLDDTARRAWRETLSHFLVMAGRNTYSVPVRLCTPLQRSLQGCLWELVHHTGRV